MARHGKPQTEHGQLKLATANLEHASVCLFAIAQISSKGPHCGFALRHDAHDACVHMHNCGTGRSSRVALADYPHNHSRQFYHPTPLSMIVTLWCVGSSLSHFNLVFKAPRNIAHVQVGYCVPGKQETLLALALGLDRSKCKPPPKREYQGKGW